MKIQTQAHVESAPAGRHACGDNLYLIVDASGARRWLWYYPKGDGKRGEKGLGSATGAKGRKVTLEEARKAAKAHGEGLARGGDPVAKVPTVAEFAETVIAELRKGWRGAATEISWRKSFTKWAKDVAALPINTPAAELTKRIGAALNPWRHEKYDTIRHARQRLEEVFRAAKSAGLRDGENPASRDSLGWGKLRAGARKPVKHRRALPFEDAPAFFAALDMREEGHAGLKLMAMTVTRTGEVRAALAKHFALDTAAPTWTLPMTKNGERDRMVPLTADAVRFMRPILEGLGPDDPVFPYADDRIMLKAFRALTHAALDAHGLRGCFKSWCGDQTPFGRDIIEECYGHSGAANATEKAYRQRAALNKQRQVFSAWNAFLAGRLPLVRNDITDESAMLQALFPAYKLAA